VKAGNFLEWARRLGLWVAIALMLCLLALFNGQPFFYPDTPTYLRGAEMGATKLAGPNTLKPWLPAPDVAAVASAAASSSVAEPVMPSDPVQTARKLKPLTSVADKVVLAGRSVYYGILLYAGYLTGGMWLAVMVQALCVAYVLQLLMVRLWALSTGQVLGTVAALSLLTPLGIYTGFLMPDVFAPLVILIIGTMSVYWRQLTRGQCGALAAILLFGLCAHSSHVALAVLMLVLALAGRLFSAYWRSLSGAALLVLAICIAAAGAAEWAFSKAVTAAVGAPPLRLPHPMARLIDLGPGTTFLKQRCPGAGYAACDFVQNYPTAWEDFLFSSDPAKGAFALADVGTKRRLSDEQLRFVLDVVRFDPLGVTRGVALDVLRQLGLFRVDIGVYTPAFLAMYEGRVPDRIFLDMQRSRAGQLWPFNDGLSAATYAMVLASLVLAVWLRRRARLNDQSAPLDRLPTAFDLAQRHIRDFAVVVIAGVVANAVVCATLASSLDRFQARVIWLLPFLALTMLAVARQARLSDTGISAFRHSTSTPNLSIQGSTP